MYITDVIGTDDLETYTWKSFERKRKIKQLKLFKVSDLHVQGKSNI